MTWSPLPSAEDPPPRRLQDSLDEVLAQLGGPAVDVLRTIHDRWPDLIGPAAAAATEPIAVEHGVLVIGVTEAAWASQVRWLEADIVRRAAELLGPDHIGSVVARVRP